MSDEALYEQTAGAGAATQVRIALREGAKMLLETTGSRVQYWVSQRDFDRYYKPVDDVQRCAVRTPEEGEVVKR